MRKGLKVLALIISMFTLSTCVKADEINVAKIGDKEYATLEEAIKVVDTNEKIELLGNAILDIGRVDKEITIVGNGYMVTVPTQTSTNNSDSRGRLIVNSKLTFEDTVVYFSNNYENGWSVVMGSDSDATGSELNFLNNSKVTFEDTGIYVGPRGVINVDNSTVTLQNMKYTSIMGVITTRKDVDSYPVLNISNGSVFTIKEQMDINGITNFHINVDKANLNITDCANQGLVASSLTLTNGAEADISRNSTGFNMYSYNTITVNDGTTLKMNDNTSRALMMQGKGNVLVKAGGTFEVLRNGSDWSKEDSEELHYATKSAITIGVYGYYEAWGYIYTKLGDQVVFEDGALVDISNNYVRGISNFGDLRIGATTKIMNNGGETVGQGGGIYNAGTTIINDGAKIYNNHAYIAGDDMFNESVRGNVSSRIDTPTIKIASVGEDWKLDGEPDCEDRINGWYDDNSNNRWEAHGETLEDDYIEKVSEGEYRDELAIKAAHDKLMGIVVVRYLDSDGNELTDEIITTDIVGNKYVTEKKEFEGYTFISVEGEVSGEYIDGTVYVTYYYDKNIGTGDIEPPQTGADFGRINTSQIEIVLYRKEEE